AATRVMSIIVIEPMVMTPVRFAGITRPRPEAMTVLLKGGKHEKADSLAEGVSFSRKTKECANLPTAGGPE
ncbi:MAG TPA: hypothetical protein VEC58_05725, partial [Roseiarcus sp.]|nr:hypothetical protein [Roseiarcus sp.]